MPENPSLVVKCNYLEGWLEELGYPYNRLWLDVVSYCKINGNNRGSCKAVAPSILARFAGCPEADMLRLIEAALAAGALTIVSGQWVVTVWKEFQTPDAKRVRERRERRDLLRTNPTCYGQVPLVTDKLVETSVTTADCYGQVPLVTDKGSLPPSPPPPSLDSPTPPISPQPSPVKAREADLQIAPLLPEPYRTEKLDQAWNSFVRHRKDKKVAPYKSEGLKKLATMLVSNGITPEDLPELIGSCVASNWNGIPVPFIERWNSDRERARTRGQPSGGSRPTSTLEQMKQGSRFND